MSYYVYVMASQRNGTLYVGMTNDFVRRVHEHKEGFVAGFTKQYDVKILVHYEELDDPLNAIAREKQLKAWRRAWKVRLIEDANPYWNDPYAQIV